MPSSKGFDESGWKELIQPCWKLIVDGFRIGYGATWGEPANDDWIMANKVGLQDSHEQTPHLNANWSTLVKVFVQIFLMSERIAADADRGLLVNSVPDGCKQLPLPKKRSSITDKGRYAEENAEFVRIIQRHIKRDTWWKETKKEWKTCLFS